MCFAFVGQLAVASSDPSTQSLRRLHSAWPATQAPYKHLNAYLGQSIPKQFNAVSSDPMRKLSEIHPFIIRLHMNFFIENCLVCVYLFEYYAHYQYTVRFHRIHSTSRCIRHHHISIHFRCIVAVCAYSHNDLDLEIVTYHICGDFFLFLRLFFCFFVSSIKCLTFPDSFIR